MSFCISHVLFSLHPSLAGAVLHNANVHDTMYMQLVNG